MTVIDIFSKSYRHPGLARDLMARIAANAGNRVRLMEVCGTHTMAIFRHGIRDLLPQTITLLSGPGCPVCVTDQADLDAIINLARRENVIMATFGDMLRVPGGNGSLQQARSTGADVRVVYSPLDALRIAAAEGSRTVVFAGVGFETTAPAVAAAVIQAQQDGLNNFCVYSAHKTVPAALTALMANRPPGIDGFLLPGHVSVIIGLQGYASFWQRFQIPCVAAGFEPVDILAGIWQLIRQIESGVPLLANAYGRAVRPEGNPRARQIMEQVFEPADANWRGIGMIPGSGLAIRESLSAFDARRRFALTITAVPDPEGCSCGEILSGLKTPPQCALFRRECTPLNPIGPCMVSGEGTCAAYYRYQKDRNSQTL